jgi:hypothetical protein
MDEILLFGQQVFGHAAIPLPSISASILRAGARDHVAPPAIVAYTATGDVIHDHAVAYLETAATRTGFDNLSAWFVAGDYSLVAFRTFAKMLVVDCADV